MVTRKIGRKAASQWQLHLHFWVKRKCPVTACSAISACGKAQHWEKSLEIYQISERENRKQLSKPASLGRQEMQFTNFNALTHTHFFVMHYTFAQYAKSSYSLMLFSFMRRHRLLMNWYRKVYPSSDALSGNEHWKQHLRAFHDPAPLNATLAAFANAALWTSALKLLEVSPAELPGWNAVSWSENLSMWNVNAMSGEKLLIS